MDALSALPWKIKGSTLPMDKGERLLLETRHHWMKYMFPAVVYALLLFVGGSIFVFGPSIFASSPAVGRMLSLATLIVVLAAHHWFFHLMLSENVTDILLTNKRIILLAHRLWLSHTRDQLVIDRIKMVEVHRRGLLRNLFNYGDLSCLFDVSAGKTFFFLPNPQKWAGEIGRLIHGS
jgi:hypothetical protein